MCVKRRLAHLCPDGVQKRERSKPTPARPSFGTSIHNGDTALDGVGSGDGESSSAVWSKLASLEHKLDLLLADRGMPASSRQTSSGLHDLANIATDYSRLAKEAEPPGQRQGLLALHADGRSSYVGPHAHSVYLAREELQDTSRAASPTRIPASRPGSPTPVDLEVMAAQPVRHNEEGYSSPDTLTPSNSDSHASLMAWATPGFRSPHSSTAIWNHLRPMLPRREVAQRLVEVYFASVSFMHVFISREEMEQDIWPVFYGDEPHTSSPPANFHPHKMSLFFAILALGVLLDVKRPQRDPVGRALYSCAWSALVLANFTESTSLEAMLALVHVALYLTWRRAGRYAESAWPLFGVLSSMMTRSGLHRDPEHFDLGEEERERRRRVFWDLHGVEVLRALAFCRPPAIRDRHVDVRLPTAWRLPAGDDLLASVGEQTCAFHAAKSLQTQLINRILDDCLCATSTYSSTIEYDARVRRLMKSYPEWMAPRIVSLSQRSGTGIEDMERTYVDQGARDAMLHTMRSHLTFLNTHQMRLLLHRGWFSEAIQQMGEMEASPNEEKTHSKAQGDGKNGTKASRFMHSVDAVNQSAAQIIKLVTSLWSQYPALVIRWMFFWNGLFSAAVCRGLFAVKRRRGGEAHAAWRDLRAAIALLRLAVDGWKPLESPLGILLRLDRRAEMALGSAAGKGPETIDGEDLHERVRTAEQAADAARAVRLHGEDMSLIGDANARYRGKPAKRANNALGSLDRMSRLSNTGKRVRIKEDLTHSDGREAESMSSLALNAGRQGDVSSTLEDTQLDHSNGMLSDGAGALMQLDLSLFSPHDLTLPASLPAFMVGGTAGNVHDDVLPVLTSTAGYASQPTDSNLLGANNAFANPLNASQLIQMLSAGVGWDDVTSWDHAILDL